MPEVSHGLEAPDHRPNGEGAKADPGYPPPGHAERMAALAANEAAAAGDDPNAALEADMAALEAGGESPTEREARLSEFLATHFADLPENATPLALERCLLFEDGCRELFEEPDLQLSEEDAQDPELVGGLAALESYTVEVSENDAAIAVQTDAKTDKAAEVTANETDAIPATEAKRAEVKSAKDTLQARLIQRNETEDREGAKNIEVNRDLETVKDLQANFEALKAKQGTIGALEALLDGEGGVKSPEMRAVVRRAINTARAVVTALPGREADLAQLLDTTGLDLTAENTAGMFAGLLTAAETSDKFSDADMAIIRRALDADEADVDTGGDANELFASGMIEEYTDEDGNPQTRRAALQPGDEVEYKDGHRLGIDQRGEKYVRIKTKVGLTFRSPLPQNPTDEAMGHIIRTAETRAMLHSINMAEPFYPQINFEEQSGGEMVIYPSDYLITERILGPLTGNRALAGNDLLTHDDIAQSLHLLQFVNEKGDAAQGDVNPEQMREAYRQNGIIADNGSINWERYTEMMEANRAGLWTGEEDFNAAA